ncbi:reverse transcriptase domain-containing protein [Tanacetum coccineum]|uniref:Reverse transcriptase domain-containing protein n=1 Tax=Tanacetum coccineum TaxID=301880 RepID=A0ABQ5EZE0_9ASTR
MMMTLATCARIEIVGTFHFYLERINDVLDNVDAIHENFKGERLAKEYPLKNEDEAIKHNRYKKSLEETIIKFYEDTIKKHTADDERMRKILENTKSNKRALKIRTKNLQEKAYQLTHKVLTNTREKVKAITKIGKENIKEPIPRDLPPMPFLGHLKKQIGSLYRTRETIRMNGNPEEIHNAKAHDDKGDMDFGWDITSKDAEKLRQFLTPTIHTLPNLKPVAVNSGKMHRDKELAGRWRYRFPPNFKFQSNALGVSYMEDDVDISSLTIEQYISLIPDDIKPGIVYPKIGDDIVDLFHFPGITHDAFMLRGFPITLNGRALRWKDRLPVGSFTTWDLLKKEFIWRYCHPFITAKKLEEIRNFKQERDETLYYAWERYNDLLYQCQMHDLNCQQKVYIFYTGLDISTRKILDSNGFIPLMTPTQALESIQVMADHSHDWGTSNQGTADDEKMRKILENTESNIRALKTRTKNLQEEAYQLTHKVLTNTGEKVKAITIIGKENMKEPVPHDLPPTPFLGHLKEQMGIPYKTRKTVRMNENPEEIHNAKAQDNEGDMDVSWDIIIKDVERLRQSLTPTTHTLPNLEPVGKPYIPLGLVHDRDKIVREEEQDYDIPLNDSVMQPLTP